MTNENGIFPARDVRYVSVAHRAQGVSDAANVAYWTEGFTKQFHDDDILEKMRELAEALGFDLVKREPAPIAEAAE